MIPEPIFMQEALTLAREAGEHLDIPVGCVVVEKGKIIGRGRNRRELLNDATAHAEVEAIREACAHRGTWHLDGCQLYVTLEPCPMCAGAILNARIGTVIYGAANAKTGCCDSVLSLFQEGFNHRPVIYGGLMEAEAAHLLREFFRPGQDE